jgi:hypothetical protein
MELVVRTFLEADHVPPPASYLEKPVRAEALLKAVRVAAERIQAKPADIAVRRLIRPPEASDH